MTMDTTERNQRADAIMDDMTGPRMAFDSANGIIYTATYADGTAGGSGDMGNYHIAGDAIRHYDTGRTVTTWIGKRRMTRLLARFATTAPAPIVAPVAPAPAEPAHDAIAPVAPALPAPFVLPAPIATTAPAPAVLCWADGCDRPAVLWLACFGGVPLCAACYGPYMASFDRVKWDRPATVPIAAPRPPAPGGGAVPIRFATTAPAPAAPVAPALPAPFVLPAPVAPAPAPVHPTDAMINAIARSVAANMGGELGWDVGMACYHVIAAVITSELPDAIAALTGRPVAECRAAVSDAMGDATDRMDDAAR